MNTSDNTSRFPEPHRDLPAEPAAGDDIDRRVDEMVATGALQHWRAQVERRVLRIAADTGQGLPDHLTAEEIAAPAEEESRAAAHVYVGERASRATVVVVDGQHRLGALGRINVLSGRAASLGTALRNSRRAVPSQQPGGRTAVIPPRHLAGPQPSRYPPRPDPADAAAEVWALVERAQAGESEAFGLIYDRYVDTVFRFVYFRVGNRQLAEDLTSDTFLRALKRIRGFTWQGRDVGAWLVTIARNLVADHFKSGRYRLEVSTGDVLDGDREDPGPQGSPESAVLDHITNVALLTAVKQLNPEQQECIVLRFLMGFSVAETAQTMGKNEGAIKALQYRAVRALARLLPDGFTSAASR
ncbi:sigma-70 family RNA polymerase sigma factor [Actinoplanes sp. NPDC049118]|uniref:sigma-70 family RNA polymerase sigma factor n=1 Tax=Actinoplanes sp. NPDC049118 TaxID=3155769 RepID=UPI00340D1023